MRVFYNSGKLGLARVQSFLIWATPAIWIPCPGPLLSGPNWPALKKKSSTVAEPEKTHRKQ
jgi:hypothetical protein